jgi:hypothetical protein
MDPNVSALGRAFQMARSGEAAPIADIKTKLRRQGYEASAVMGPLLERQLRTLIHEAKERQGGFGATVLDPPVHAS